MLSFADILTTAKAEHMNFSSLLWNVCEESCSVTWGRLTRSVSPDTPVCSRPQANEMHALYDMHH